MQLGEPVGGVGKGSVGPETPWGSPSAPTTPTTGVAQGTRDSSATRGHAEAEEKLSEPETPRTASGSGGRSHHGSSLGRGAA